jgi:mitochondrial fission protein ELM1
MENQCMGLAEAIGLPFTVKQIHPRAPWKFLPPVMWPAPLVSLGPTSDPISPPWPRLLIATGRLSVAISMAVRRHSGGRTFTVQIQNPAVSPRHFDLVVPPRHDRISGPNVVSSRGALHRVTSDRLAQASKEFTPMVAHLPRPLVAVLVGGDNGVYKLTAQGTRELAANLLAMAKSTGAGLAVTPSRRTGSANEKILREALADAPAVFWDGTGANPYFGFLGLADAVVATCDSVSMASEAAATGKPVYIVDLEGNSLKFDEFHQGLRDDGITRPFKGTLETWTYAPLDDTAQVAALVHQRLNAHSGAR